MDKTYQPHAIETSRYNTWESENYFAPQGAGESYTIMIPPPNVTGSLHMGHGFNNAIMDALIRFRRMQGRNTLWQPGTDHAGIATQMLVERQLEAKGQNRHDLGREKFPEKVWEWKDQSGGNISRQIRRLGSSVDWTRERFTMDDGLSEAVKEAFVRLHEDGLIYRGKRLVNWDTSCIPPFPTSKWKTTTRKATCGTCATHWPMAPRPPKARTTWSLPPPVRKPYWVTRPLL